MPNYALSINSTFQPLSFERYIQPYQIYGEEYKRQEQALNELEMKASIWEGLANKQTDKAAYEQYKQYADALREQANLIAQEGLSIGSRNALNDLKRRYVTEIFPIEQAYTRRAEQQKAQRQIRMSDKTAFFNRLASQVSLDEYMNNPTLDVTEQQASGALITSMVSNIGKQIAQELTGFGMKNLPEDSYTNMFSKKYGLSIDDVAKYLQNPNDPSNKAVLKAIVDQAVGTTGIDKWNNPEALELAAKYGNLGLWDTVGKTETQLTENFGARKALEHKYHEQEADAAFSRAVKLENIRTANEIEKYWKTTGAAASNDPSGGIAFGADSISFENGQLVLKDPASGDSISLGSIAGMGGSGGKGKSGSGSGNGSGIAGTLPFNTVDVTTPNFGSNAWKRKVNQMNVNLGYDARIKDYNAFVYVELPSKSRTKFATTFTAGPIPAPPQQSFTKKFRLWTFNKSKQPIIMNIADFISQGKTSEEKIALAKYYKEKVIPAKRFFGLDTTITGEVVNPYRKLHNAYEARWGDSGSVSAQMLPLKMDENDVKSAVGWLVNRVSPNRDDRSGIREVTYWNKDGKLTFGDRVPAKDLLKKDGSLVDSNTEILDRPIPGNGADNDASKYFIVHANGKYYAFPKSKLGTIMDDSYETSIALSNFNKEVKAEVDRLKIKIKAEYPKMKDKDATKLASDLLKQLNPGLSTIYNNLGSAYLRQTLGGLNYTYEVEKSKAFVNAINSIQ